MKEKSAPRSRRRIWNLIFVDGEEIKRREEKRREERRGEEKRREAEEYVEMKVR